MTNHLQMAALILLSINAYVLLVIALEVGVPVANLTPMLGVVPVIALVTVGILKPTRNEVAQ